MRHGTWHQINEDFYQYYDYYFILITPMALAAPFWSIIHPWPACKVPFLYFLPKNTQELFFSLDFHIWATFVLFIKSLPFASPTLFQSFCTAWGGGSFEFCSFDAKLLQAKSDKWQFATFYHRKAHRLKQKGAIETYICEITGNIHLLQAVYLNGRIQWVNT